MKNHKFQIANLIGGILLVTIISIFTIIHKENNKYEYERKNQILNLEQKFAIIKLYPFLMVKTNYTHFENQYNIALSDFQSYMESIKKKEPSLTLQLEDLINTIAKLDVVNQKVFSLVKFKKGLEANRISDSLEYEILTEKTSHLMNKLLKTIINSADEAHSRDENYQLALIYASFFLLLSLGINLFKKSSYDADQIVTLNRNISEFSNISNIGLITYDLKNNKTFINKIATDFLNLNENSQWKDVVSRFEENDQQLLEALVRHKRSDSILDITLKKIDKKKNGTNLTSLDIKVRYDSNENIIYANITDVSHHVKLINELEQAQKIAKIGNWTLDLVNKRLHGSSVFYSLLDQMDYPEGNNIYEHYLSLIHIEDRDRFLYTIHHVSESGNNYIFKHRIINPATFQVKYLISQGIPIKDEHGKIVLISGTMQDITEQTLQENKFKEIYDQNYAILKNTKMIIITCDLNGIITSFNDESEKIFGYTASDLVGLKCIESFFLNEELIEHSRFLRTEYQTDIPPGFGTLVFKAKFGESEEKKWTYTHQDGKNTKVMQTVTGLYDSSNHLYGYLIVARNITQELELKNKLELEKSKSLINSKLASLGEMSAGIAHEVNNPLAIITGNLEILKSKHLTANEVTTRINTIDTSIKRIEKIITNLKKFSRVNVSSVRKIESLNEIINTVVPLVGIKANKHHVLIEAYIENNIYINCDIIEIEQVLINLIHNGIDAVKNLNERWVKVKSFINNGIVITQIIDSGNGIPKEVEDKIFQPFYTTKPVGEGTGLGLSITKGILDEHGVKLELNRNISNTCFEFSFPLATPSNAEHILDKKKSA